MRIGDWLNTATNAFTASGIDSARLDALILLEDALDKDRAWLLAHSEETIPATALSSLADKVERRLQHEPLAYIRGHAEFYGRRFMVDDNVLIPRPESETMIELLKKIVRQDDVIADIGTGSGCLAITAALETGAVVYAVDIDEACLAVAERNAMSLTTSIKTLHGSLLEPFLNAGSSQPTILLANLPYVPDEYPVNDAAKHEPALALFAGNDGLDMHQEFFTQIKRLSWQPKYMITEALTEQHTTLIQLARNANYSLHSGDGLAQCFKFQSARS